MRATTAKAVRNRRSNRSVSLTLAAVAAQATGTPSPVTATWDLVPRLPRSVGFGPVRSPPRLARTLQLSRIRSGPPRSMATSRACTRWSRLTSAHSARRRRRVEPLAWSAVARRPRHGVPSRRNRRRVASTRTVAAGGCPGPGSPGPSQRSITVPTRSKILRSTSVPLPVAERPQMGIGTAAGAAGPSQPGMDVETTSKQVPRYPARRGPLRREAPNAALQPRVPYGRATHSHPRVPTRDVGPARQASRPPGPPGRPHRPEDARRLARRPAGAARAGRTRRGRRGEGGPVTPPRLNRDTADDARASLDAADALALRLYEHALAVDRIARTCRCAAHRATALATQDDRDFKDLRAHLADARDDLDGIVDREDDP